MCKIEENKRLKIEDLPYIQEFTKTFEEKVGAFMQLKIGRSQDINIKFVPGYCVIDEYCGASEFYVLDKDGNTVDCVDLKTQIDFETNKRKFLIVANKWNKKGKAEHFAQKSFDTFENLIDDYILYRLNIYR
jgi:hypothetical protein